MLIDSYRYSGLGGDIYFSLVTTLLHMNGTDEAAVFTDSSSYTRTVTVTPSAVTDTAIAKFGVSAGRFPGDGVSRIDFGSTELNPTSDFTIDFWVYRNAGAAFFVSKGSRFSFISPMLIVFTGGNGVSAACTNDAGTTVVSLVSGTAVPVDTWTFISVQRLGTRFSIFQDGVETAFTTYGGSIATTNIDDWRIGPNTTAVTNVWIDDFRLTVGQGRYSGTFTPPTAEFPNT